MESQADTATRFNQGNFDNTSSNNTNDRDKNGNEGADEAPGPSRPKIKFNPNDLYYDMSGEKHLVVFNHYKYDEVKNPQEKRENTGKDVEALQETFESMGFTVVVHHDKERAEIWDILTELRDTDYSAASILCIAILTHGHEGGVLYAYDHPYYLEHVTRLFENHPTLAGKPKLFFIQACRGGKMDDGSQIETDGEKKGFIVPSPADFLIMRSTVEDYVSWLDTRGSWMIQELCSNIMQYRDHLDILGIVTLVQRAVAFAYASYVKNDSASSYKRQMVETSFTLTSFLKL